MDTCSGRTASVRKRPMQELANSFDPWPGRRTPNAPSPSTSYTLACFSRSTLLRAVCPERSEGVRLSWTASPGLSEWLGRSMTHPDPSVLVRTQIHIVNLTPCPLSSRCSRTLKPNCWISSPSVSRAAAAPDTDPSLTITRFPPCRRTRWISPNPLSLSSQ